jgi:hypothetical protein
VPLRAAVNLSMARQDNVFSSDTAKDPPEDVDVPLAAGDDATSTASRAGDPERAQPRVAERPGQHALSDRRVAHRRASVKLAARGLCIGAPHRRRRRWRRAGRHGVPGRIGVSGGGSA